MVGRNRMIGLGFGRGRRGCCNAWVKIGLIFQVFAHFFYHIVVKEFEN